MTSVAYTTVDGEANAGSDFVTSGILTFGVGETSMTVTVTVLNDEIIEMPESFTVQLGATTGGLTVDDGSGLGFILDNDTSAMVSISDGIPAPATEGTAATITFTVTHSEPVDHVTSVAYTTVDGEANAGSGFEFTSGILTFGVGETSMTVTVTVLNDEILEMPESFTVQLGATTGGLRSMTAAASAASWTTISRRSTCRASRVRT